MIDEVLEQRKSQLAAKHPYMLQASVNKAKVKGEVDEAEQILRNILPIVDKALGPYHLGSIWG